jgi:hypothetical protein
VRCVVIVAIVVALAPAAWAHKPSDAHLQIAVSGQHLAGTLAVALRDLDGALDLDADGDGTITWGDALAAAPRIDAYARERLTITGCTLAFGAGKLVDFSDGAYWAMPLSGECASPPDVLVVKYALLFDIDAQHRGIVQVQTARSSRTIVARSAEPIAIELGASSVSALACVGATRVWTSPFALLLLVCLVLPIATSKRRDVAIVFGTFALASTATLLLAAAELVYLPPEIVRLGLVLAVTVAATANLLRVAAGRRDLAFELGLLHGLGCAAWLDQVVAPHRLVPTLGFAVGVSASEAAFVALVTAALIAVRRTPIHLVLVWAGSAMTALLMVASLCGRWLA